MYRPLLIEFDYKNINNASGQIVRAFWESLDPNEFQPIIICKKIDNDFKSKWKLIEVPINTTILKVTNGLKMIGLRDLVQQPDGYFFSWYKPAINAASLVIEENEIDFIHSVSCPFSAQLVALYLKNKYNLFWVAQFHDPWINNVPPFKMSFFQKRFERWEKKIAQGADVLIHTNDVIVKMWKNRYPKIVSNKIYSLPLSFNTTRLPERKAPHNDKIIVSHIGEIYATRTIKDIVDALKDIFEDKPNYSEKILFRFVGRVSKAEIEYVRSSHLEKNFQFEGLLPPNELEPFYQEADIFLVLDVKKTNSPSFPSKLMMYHYYQKPIWGITVSGSIMECELIKSGHISMHYGDKQEIKDYLLTILQGNAKSINFDKNYWKQYTIEHAVSLYENVINESLK